jgi:hypothetical protein
MHTVYDDDTVCVKVGKNGLGKWGVWFGCFSGKATKLCYRRFFKTRATAEAWARKWVHDNIAQ